MADPHILSIRSERDPEPANPSEITFYTDVRWDTIVEIAEMPVQNTDWVPGRGMKWAMIDGSLIFREGSQTKVRTTLSREEVRGLMRDSTDGWITVPYTIREADKVVTRR